MQNGNVVCGTTSASRLRLDLWKLRHRASSGGEAVLRTTSQALRASSPGRGATGESVVVVLDEQSFLQSGTTGLRCLDSRLLVQHSLVERSSAVAANESKARCLAPNLSPSEQQGLPGLPRVVLPLSLFATSPSGRRESFLSGELSAKQTERFAYKASPGRRGFGIPSTSQFCRLRRLTL